MHSVKTFLIVCTIFLIAGCSYPVSSVNQGGERPALVFKGASPDAQLYLDNLLIGKASRYNGRPNKLLVEKGPHSLRIVDNGNVILEQDILVTQGETKVIEIAN